MRETYAAMGRPSARGCFVHLYLNGLYWGIYNLTERPDEHFAAAHLGGRAADYDARNADKVLNGDDLAWKQLFRLANQGVTNETQFEAIARLLDVPAFCDYMLLNFYGANADWDANSNWYAARKRDAMGRFIFFVWDGERTLENVNDNRLDVDDDFSPGRLFQKLRGCVPFREEFARCARHHLSPSGVLAPHAAAARCEHLARTLETAILAESARWGDYRRDVHPYKEGPYELYTRDAHWRPEIKRLLETYFPKRTSVFVEQLTAIQLY
jgi:spore coat protein CotH